MSLKLWTALLWLQAVSMVAVGVAHFVDPMPFVGIVPPWLPAPLMLVYVSGVAEVLGGIGLVIPRTRVWAAWGLIALFVAVFPANLYMVANDLPFGDVQPERWMQWARLPFQFVFIAWAYLFTKPAPSA